MNESEYACLKVREAMKGMAWTRAKGELRSMLRTSWSDDPHNVHSELEEAIEDFISDVEDRGLVD